MPLPAQVATQMRDQLVEEFQRESATTARVMKAIPTSKLGFKPHPKSMTFGDLAWHIVMTDGFFFSSIAKGAFTMGKMDSDVPKEHPNTTEGLVSAYEKLTAQRIAELNAISVDKLSHDVDFAGIAKLPAIAYMRWCISHDIHHRAQLAVYLRLVDAKVPSIYGPSADDNPFEK